MIDLAYYALLLALVLSIAGAAAAAWDVFTGGRGFLPMFSRVQAGVLAFVTVPSLILWNAFIGHDYSFKYVAEYSDNVLPLFYRVTAFWAGQEGSLLFWMLLIAIFAAVFSRSRALASFGADTQTLYWSLILLVQGVFLLLLTSWSNPFMELVPPPSDGRGLNPLLQHPGMIFHPPLLFIGYAGFAIGACLALASHIVGEKGPRGGWVLATRNINLISWVGLTAGIALGGWWSYMELGWGGYWAWDPVENASLVPWLTSTAFLHTALIYERHKSLASYNVFLMALTFMLCIVGTWVVRSGAIDSLHAFGESGVATPLTIFIVAGLVFSAWAAITGRDPGASREMGGILTRSGLLLLMSWLFVALSAIVLVGTLWPLISVLWSTEPQGLTQEFYNVATPPLFVVAGVLCVLAPWFNEAGSVRRRGGLIASIGVLVALTGVFLAMGMTISVSALAAGAGVAIIFVSFALFKVEPAVRGDKRSVAAYATHIGLGLCFVGIAFSGPYMVEREAVLEPGATMQVDEYTVTYEGTVISENPRFLEAKATLRVTKDGQDVGTLRPARRIYTGFNQPYAEASVIPSIGDELYGTLHAVTEEDIASITVSTHPLVNWLWLGCVILCIAPLFGLRRWSKG